MKNIIKILSFIFLCQGLNGQLELPYASSILHGNYINPAHVDRDSVIHFTFLNREQWNGAVGTPSSQVLGALFPLDENSKLGANIFRNASGVQSRFTLDMNYSYLLRVNEARLRFGLVASFQQGKKDFTKQNVLLIDPLESDPVIEEGIYSFTSFNTGIGMHYRNGIFGFGISLPRLLANRIGLFGSDKVSNNTPLFANVTVNAPIGRGSTLKNRLHLQFDSDQYSLLQYYIAYNYRGQMDAGVQLNSQITNGFGLQSIDFLIALAIHRDFSLGLSYGVPLSPINQVSPGSFEVFLSYAFRRDY
ncbi:PorP/SprF family type IX secretion system membrane protein [Portibacter marinus]|uniref:PorP/SprF family type IX secretion system membrane protein n=1 Tax=Portibacter marinus TaxID=2898660 RepID=UPI001F16AFA8|nr:PorP/SprF family type IX secretion system membrane protein [Portibacter marinus]